MILRSCDDAASCAREILLSITSIITCGALSFALFRRCVSSHGRSTREATIIGLSILQTALSTIFYGTGADGGEIVLAARTLKILQSVAISWMFLACVYDGQSNRYTHIGCTVVAIIIVGFYFFIVLTWIPDATICRDSAWISLSIVWFIVSINVSLIGTRLLREVPGGVLGLHRRMLVATEEEEEEEHKDIINSCNKENHKGIYIIDGRECQIPMTSSTKRTESRSSLAINDEQEEEEGESGPVCISPETVRNGGSTDWLISYPMERRIEFLNNEINHSCRVPQIVGRPTTHHVNDSTLSEVIEKTQIDRKKKHLLTLIVIDTIAAGVTMTWDIFVWMYVSRDPDSCIHFLSHIPPLEMILYVTSRIIALLVPHWAVFLVFYWVERDLYRPYSTHWDIDLRGVELPPVSIEPH